MPYKKIFLTFDDGPGSQTREIAELLNRLGVKATFFMVGENIQKRPEVVKKVAELGHTIGVHGLRHEQLKKLNLSQTMREIKSVRDLIEKITGKRPTLFRVAFGELSAYSLPVLRRLGLRHVDWSHDTLDWKAALKGFTIDTTNIIRKAKNGDVVLFHDGAVGKRATNDAIRGRNLLRALPTIVGGLRERRFEFRPVTKSIQLTHRVKYAARVVGKYARAHAEKMKMEGKKVTGKLRPRRKK